MAYVGKVSIKGAAHMGNAMKYIEREGKALPIDEFKRELLNSLEHLQNIQLTSGERVTCINCSSQNTFKEFIEKCNEEFNLPNNSPFDYGMFEGEKDAFEDEDSYDCFIKREHKKNNADNNITKF